MPLRRIALIIGVTLALVATVLGVMRWQRKVEVTTGTRVVCTYGHPISEDIKTIEVSPDKAGAYRVKTVTRVCDKHAQAEKLYAEAQAAIVKGDNKKAMAKLTQVVALDPKFQSAAEQLETIKGGKKASSDSGRTTPDSAPEPKEEPGEGGAIALTAWVPSSLSGFVAQKPLVEAMAVTRQYFPSSGNDIIQLVIVAEQFKTATGAKRALVSEVKARYTRDSDNVTIGRSSVYFGTDGNRYAAVGFTRGAVMVAVEMASKPGVDPSRLKGALVDIVEQLP